MFSPFTRLKGILGSSRQTIRMHRRIACWTIGVVVVVGSGLGIYGYALRSWHVAQIAEKEGRLREAQNALELCLWIWPRSVDVHLLAARIARRQGDFPGAEVHLNQCLRLRPGATKAIQLEFFLMRVQGGQEDEVAVYLLTQYVDTGSPEAPVILDTLAQAYLRNLRYAPAWECLSRWIEIAPTAAQPHYWRGWVLERVNDHDGAMEDYRRAVDLDPGFIAARLRLAELLLEMSNIPEAESHLERLSQQSPERVDVMARLGECRFAQGNTTEARRLLEIAVEQMPKDPGVLITLAKLELQDKNLQKGEEYVQRTLKVDPTNAEAAFVLAAALQAQERWTEANAALEQHKKNTALVKRVGQILNEEAIHPSKDPAALCELGEAFLKTNEQIGLYWLHRALQRDPSHEPTHKILAEFYEGKGNREKAAFHRKYVKSDTKTAP
jgi:tetratricopeptide (TPR) repeat protein